MKKTTDDKKKTSNIPVVLLVILVVLGLRLFIVWGLIAFLMIGSFAEKPEVYTDVTHYREYMSFDADKDHPKWIKWGMDEEIWPQNITDSMKVTDFKMVYYNPWDKQFLGYLAVDYPEEEYARERARLKAYPSTEYIGYYGVREEKTFELLAVYADSYHGFVYALTDGKGKIIYAEQIFCNYIMDLKYKNYIPEEYLLDGFDASQGNSYRKKMMSE